MSWQSVVDEKAAKSCAMEAVMNYLRNYDRPILHHQSHRSFNVRPDTAKQVLQSTAMDMAQALWTKKGGGSDEARNAFQNFVADEALKMLEAAQRERVGGGM
jgi:hypothetical protein